MAGFAAHTVKTMFKTSAFEVVLELSLHIARQRLALGSPLRLEFRVVLFDKLVKEGPRRTMALVSKPMTATILADSQYLLIPGELLIIA